MGGRAGAQLRLWAGMGVTCCLMAATSAPTARAETVVTGDEDTNMPLVIDPASDPTDPLTTATSSSSQKVMFTQRMPVTKIVDEVTLGDLSLGAGCSSGTASLMVQEHANRDPGSSGGSQFYSQASVAIGTAPAKLTWSLASVKLHKDKGYSFTVSVSGCSTFRQTTWEHNLSEVNPGSERCATGPGGWRRMWHVTGVDDAQSGCVDRPPGSRNFDPSMPSGWLVSQIGQGAGNPWWPLRRS
jgi:hypothetical protein